MRPTPDRVRETVFNWLQPYLGFAHCLDLFAGSGALGFEAASRGATQVVLVEKNRIASRQLLQHCQTLQAQQCQVVTQQAQQFLAQINTRFDIVFLDPPYQARLWSPIAEQMMRHTILNEHALIYLEYPASQAQPVLPIHWQLKKEKRAGEVCYCLFQYMKE